MLFLEIKGLTMASARLADCKSSRWLSESLFPAIQPSRLDALWLNRAAKCSKRSSLYHNATLNTIITVFLTLLHLVISFLKNSSYSFSAPSITFQAVLISFKHKIVNQKWSTYRIPTYSNKATLRWNKCWPVANTQLGLQRVKMSFKLPFLFTLWRLGGMSIGPEFFQPLLLRKTHDIQ